LSTRFSVLLSSCFSAASLALMAPILHPAGRKLCETRGIRKLLSPLTWMPALIWMFEFLIFELVRIDRPGEVRESFADASSMLANGPSHLGEKTPANQNRPISNAWQK